MKLDYRPEWVKNWERVLQLAQQGDKSAHVKLVLNYPTLPVGTANRVSEDECEYCGRKH